MKHGTTLAGQVERRSPTSSVAINEFIVPCLMATAAGVVMFAFCVCCTLPLSWAGASACIVWGLVYYWRVTETDKSRWETEIATNRDIDGDGYIGEPEVRYEFVNTEGLGNPKETSSAEVVQHALDVIQAATEGTRSPSRNQWRGQTFPSTGRRCGEAEWNEVKAWLVGRKFATDGGKAAGLALRVTYADACRRCGVGG